MRISIQIDDVTARMLEELCRPHETLERTVSRVIRGRHAAQRGLPRLAASIDAARAEYIELTGHAPEWRSEGKQRTSRRR